jgi:predicted PurR-regulated permease PerM
VDIQQFKGLPFYLKLAAVLFSLIAMVWIVIIAKDILSPLIFSCLFSILLLPFAAFLEHKLRLPRSAASMLAVLSLLACIGGLLYVIGSQVSNLASDWPQFQDQLHKTQNDIMDWIRSSFHITRHKQLTFVANTTSKVVESGGSVVGATLLSLSGMLLFFCLNVFFKVLFFVLLFYNFFNIFFFFFYTFFFLFFFYFFL